jgi:hypothetical protein
VKRTRVLRRIKKRTGRTKNDENEYGHAPTRTRINASPRRHASTHDTHEHAHTTHANAQTRISADTHRISTHAAWCTTHERTNTQQRGSAHKSAVILWQVRSCTVSKDGKGDAQHAPARTSLCPRVCCVFAHTFPRTFLYHPSRCHPTPCCS